MTWQDVVAEKRRSQEEAITHFAASNGNTESQEVELSFNPSTSARDREFLRQVAIADISCEALTLCRIGK
jgi:hypothetical protein